MTGRKPVENIIRGCKTTSAKIRALAQENYNRTEISKILGVRYQHVRKVLVDSGFKGGLRQGIEVEREPVLVDPEPSSRTTWQIDDVR